MMQETMTCDWCGKEFPLDARACVEAGITASHEDEDQRGEEWKGIHAVSVDLDLISEADRKRMKAEMSLNDVQLNELLTTGSVRDLGAIVCLECQDDCVPE